MKSIDDKVIAVIGLGYVGLPLAVEFGKHRRVIGYDIQKSRIEELSEGFDNTLEVTSEELKLSKFLTYSSDLLDIKEADIYIVTVPTPVDIYKRPDLTPLINASKAIGTLLDKGNIVIYESTVYPGATEEDCVPVLEHNSDLKFNKDFFVGYSPERINPGDKEHRVTNILKVTSGSTPEVAEYIDQLYGQVIEAGTFKASSIKVAEAAKVIENTQRDVNIALINELAIIFNKLGIDTLDVLEAAGTKWNFLPFRPGLVGGHCIGVDPYYLTHKSEAIGYHPQVILSGRRINDNMGEYVATEVVRQMLKKSIDLRDARVLVLGVTFKENCPDIRNTEVIDICLGLKEYGLNVDLYDPLASSEEVLHEYNFEMVSSICQRYDSVILAVAHDEFKTMDENALGEILKTQSVLADLKGILPRKLVDFRL